MFRYRTQHQIASRGEHGFVLVGGGRDASGAYANLVLLDRLAGEWGLTETGDALMARSAIVGSGGASYFINDGAQCAVIYRWQSHAFVIVDLTSLAAKTIDDASPGLAIGYACARNRVGVVRLLVVKAGDSLQLQRVVELFDGLPPKIHAEVDASPSTAVGPPMTLEPGFAGDGIVLHLHTPKPLVIVRNGVSASALATCREPSVIAVSAAADNATCLSFAYRTLLINSWTLSGEALVHVGGDVIAMSCGEHVCRSRYAAQLRAGDTPVFSRRGALIAAVQDWDNAMRLPTSILIFRRAR